MMDSPYAGLPVQEWEAKTKQLIKLHPLNPNEIYAVVLKSWNDLFDSKIGSRPFKIGQDLFPRPQIMGFFLHELIPLEFQYRYPGLWRREQSANEKDLVYVPDDLFSVEIKTSSSVGSIYGNRSYTQSSAVSKKSKSGYYLAVNFQKFTSNIRKPQMTVVRFGWLDHQDWLGS